MNEYNIANMPHEDMLDRILEWAKTNRKFDATTFEGIKEHYENHGVFTCSQEYAIENVYLKWKVDKWFTSRINKGRCE